MVVSRGPAVPHGGWRRFLSGFVNRISLFPIFLYVKPRRASSYLDALSPLSKAMQGRSVLFLFVPNITLSGLDVDLLSVPCSPEHILQMRFVRPWHLTTLRMGA